MRILGWDISWQSVHEVDVIHDLLQRETKRHLCRLENGMEIPLELLWQGGGVNFKLGALVGILALDTRLPPQ